MDKYISREAVNNMLLRYFHNLKGNEAQVLVSDIRQAMFELPTADVVEVVRCRDCEYGIPYQDNPFEDETGWIECSYYGCGISDEEDHFCKHGKRKDGEKK